MGMRKLIFLFAGAIRHVTARQTGLIGSSSSLTNMLYDHKKTAGVSLALWSDPPRHSQADGLDRMLQKPN